MLLQHNNKTSNGFTIIELLVALVIVAIVSAIAVPAYTDHVTTTKRAAAQQFMMEISNLQEQYFGNNRSYTTDLSSNGLNATAPSSLDDRYTFTVTVTNIPPAFLVTAKAIGSQVDDGNLTFSSDGTKTPETYW